MYVRFTKKAPSYKDASRWHLMSPTSAFPSASYTSGVHSSRSTSKQVHLLLSGNLLWSLSISFSNEENFPAERAGGESCCWSFAGTGSVQRPGGGRSGLQLSGKLFPKVILGWTTRPARYWAIMCVGRPEKGWGWIGRNCWSVWCWPVKFGTAMLVGKTGLRPSEEDDFCAARWSLASADCFVAYPSFPLPAFGETWDNNKLFSGWVVEDSTFWQTVLEISWGEDVWITSWILVSCSVGATVSPFSEEAIPQSA